MSWAQSLIDESLSENFSPDRIGSCLEANPKHLFHRDLSDADLDLYQLWGF